MEFCASERLHSKYPPAEPVALRLLAPQRGLIATGQSKSKNKSKSLELQTSRRLRWLTG
jgi:hypothetical protein